MKDKISNYTEKRRAFSYLELIIAMALVSIIIIVSGPLIATVSEKSAPYGEFKCYARYDNETNTWKLYQNQRINSPSFPIEDEEVTSTGCEFKKLNGVSSYTVTLIGGGGSGSAPYFIGVQNGQYIDLALGQDGSNGEEKVIVDDLTNAFVNNVITIKFCDIATGGITACIGKGGEKIVGYDSSYIQYEKIEDIQSKLNAATYSNADENYLLRLGIQAVTDAVNEYAKNRTAENTKSLIQKLEDNKILDEGKNTGRSGKATKIKNTNNEFVIAKGGKYGLSDPDEKQTLEIDSDYIKTDGSSKYFCSSVDKNIITISNEYINIDGDDGDTVINDTETYKNFGYAGKAGVLVCKLPSDNDYSKLYFDKGNNIEFADENKCYASSGGRGAGGAIKIQWH